ncbi:hypothetical protein Hanom_Chr09g00807211 [Helianthus anomalus]
MQIFRLKILLLFIMKVGIPEFLNGIGNGVETYAEKLEAEFGDLQNLTYYLYKHCVSYGLNKSNFIYHIIKKLYF